MLVQLSLQKPFTNKLEATWMKRSRTEVMGKARDGLSIRFESQNLTSFSGLIIFQRLFAQLDLKARLRRCFRHRRDGRIYADHLMC